MAFKPKNMNSRNPTGDRAFNAVTRIVHGPPTDPAEPDADDGPIAPSPSAPPPPPVGGKPQPKRMGGAKKYSTATHSFHNC